MNAGTAHDDARDGGYAPETRAAAAMGVYVHFPWCLAKCPYCDFLSIAVDSPEAGRPPTAPEARSILPHRAYADAVLNELELRLTRLARPLPRLGSIFFGGGTPSLWDPSEMGRVLRAILSAFDARASDVEITVECNPSSLDAHHVEGLLGAGVNRVSIGVQALELERLRFLGRLHDAGGALAAISTALSVGMPRVSADLIYGVYKQDPDAAVDEVNRVADLGVTHLSAYALTIEPNTRFGSLARTGHLPLLDDDLVARSFERVSDTLRARGFRHYEISNFAHAGAESIHNQGYWLGRDYLGLGTGAFGTVRLADATNGERVRYKNLLSAERYARAWNERTCDFDPFVDELSEREELGPETSLKEVLLLGLRLEDGIDVAVSERAMGAPLFTRARRKAANRLIQAGKLEEFDGRLRIPRQHWLFADGIIRDLL